MDEEIEEIEKKWAEARKIAGIAIKHFEGCGLVSYVKFGESWATIGYGCAIPLSEHPKKINQAQADQMFERMLDHKIKQLQSEIPLKVLDALPATALGGIIAFRYNVKDNAWLSPSCNTRKLLIKGDLKGFMAMHQLWCHGEKNQILKGLKRRRRVEGELMQGIPIEHLQAFKFYAHYPEYR